MGWVKRYVALSVAFAAIASPGRPAVAIAAMAVVNVGILAALKRCSGLPRPRGSSKEGFGMPSSHAGELALIAGFASVWGAKVIAEAYRPDGSKAADVMAAGALATVLPVAAMECRDRVSRRYHTWGQTAAGALEGASLAIITACIVWGNVPELQAASSGLDWLVGALGQVRDAVAAGTGQAAPAIQGAWSL